MMTFSGGRTESESLVVVGRGWDRVVRGWELRRVVGHVAVDLGCDLLGDGHAAWGRGGATRELGGVEVDLVLWCDLLDRRT